MSEYRKCFLCGRSETEYNKLEVHHIFQGRGRRQLSDRYGLTVLLCRNCHTQSKYSAHMNGDVADYLHRYGQRKAMAENGWSSAEFREIFGKNYLDEEE